MRCRKKKTIIELLKEIRPECDFKNSRNFFRDGLLDSLTVYELIGAIGENYEITLKRDDLVPENFINMDALKKLILQYGILEE